MNHRCASLVALAVVALGACGDPSESSSAARDPAVADDDATVGASATTATVTIGRSRFDQAELRIAPGTTVVFDNTDPFAHTITSTRASPTQFDSGELSEDERFEFTFEEPGRYPYFCRIHPTMRAVVIVE
jgi:plastocyanin